MADRICAGIIDPQGSIHAGSGFDVEHITDGVFTILFQTDFTTVLGASVTQIHPWPMQPGSHGSNPLDNAVIIYLDKQKMRLQTGDATGKSSARAFSFIVFGS